MRARSFSLLFAASTLALTLQPLSAQPVASIRAATAIVAETNVSLNVIRNTIPAGTPIVNDVVVSSMQNGASATAEIAPRGAAGMELSTRTSATGMFLGSAASVNGAVGYALSGSSRGWITLDLAGRVALFASADVRVLVTGPGISEGVLLNAGMQAITRRTAHYASFTNGLVLTCSVQVGASSGQPRTTSAEATVGIDFTPALPPVQQVSYGAPCGATLAVNDATTLTSHDVRLRIDGAFPSFPALFVFGGRRASIPIGGCLLLTEPIAAISMVADARGQAALGLVLPGPLQSATFVVQALAYDAAFQVRTSAGVELQFVD